MLQEFDAIHDFIIPSRALEVCEETKESNKYTNAKGLSQCGQMVVFGVIVGERNENVQEWRRGYEWRYQLQRLEQLVCSAQR